MLQKIVKIVVVVIVLNAVTRVGVASWNYYQLRDMADETVMFGGRESPAGIQNQIMKKANELGLPVTPESITVQRFGYKTQADGKYTQAIELFPSYVYPFTFTFRVESVSMVGLK